jgi:DNA-binding beta-propeller fold protein YncE
LNNEVEGCSVKYGVLGGELEDTERIMPSGIAIDEVEGRIYVSNCESHRIEVYSKSTYEHLFK